MESPRVYANLTCRACGGCEHLDRREILARLREFGMLRKEADPAVELMGELLLAAADRLVCRECEAIGLKVELADDEEGWGEGQDCEACGQPIPLERLEILPEATLCAACQEKVDAGEPVGHEYCPKCGAPMMLKLSRRAGIARYEMACTALPPCRL